MGIEKHAAFYRGYQPDDRSLFPVAIVLVTLIGLWLLVYLVSAVGPPSRPVTIQSPPHSTYAVPDLRVSDRGLSTPPRDRWLVARRVSSKAICADGVDCGAV